MAQAMTPETRQEMTQMTDIELLKQQALELKLHGVLAHWDEITEDQHLITGGLFRTTKTSWLSV